MASRTLSILFLAVFMSVALAKCPGTGDAGTHWTEGPPSTWYYCQTSQTGRKLNNCYIDITPEEGKDKLNATVFESVIGSDDKAQDPLSLVRVGDGKYVFEHRDTYAVNLKVSPNQDCLALWKCPHKDAKWDGVSGDHAYFMLLCNDQTLCKPQAEYEGDYKAVLDFALEFHPEMKGSVDDIDQADCKSKYPEKYPA